jgi:large subunit ribosomal protein L29
MDASKLRELSDNDLQQELDDASRQLFELRVQSQAERLDSPSQIKAKRRLIARIKTIRHERAQEQPEEAASE